MSPGTKIILIIVVLALCGLLPTAIAVLIDLVHAVQGIAHQLPQVTPSP